MYKNFSERLSGLFFVYKNLNYLKNFFVFVNKNEIKINDGGIQKPIKNFKKTLLNDIIIYKIDKEYNGRILKNDT